MRTPETNKHLESIKEILENNTSLYDEVISDIATTVYSEFKDITDNDVITSLSCADRSARKILKYLYGVNYE